MSEIFYMDGYGVYVWSAYSFTFISLLILFHYYYSSLLKKEKELRDLQKHHE
ncbi:heme exporter protein CcmD [Pelagibacterales bacterium]|jgi:heme exporter protein CcmD|nr:heme exporter protein CcmD [Pelagibacterales bacterium]|tara:strand:- start:394 stop:549 length:156 start_codon:yes stop_codon:yes gene_type:complete